MYKNAENNPKYKNLNKPLYLPSNNVLEIIWIIILSLKIFSWYRVKTTGKNSDIDLIFFASLTLRLLYVYCITELVNLRLSLLIAVLAFFFSLFYLNYVQRYDKIGAIVAAILVVWSLYLVNLNLQLLQLN